MNALLLAAASAGAIAVFLTSNPGHSALAHNTQSSAHDNAAKVETAKPTKLALDHKDPAPPANKPTAKAQLPRKSENKSQDRGSMTRTTMVDPDTGEETHIDIIAFNDG